VRAKEAQVEKRSQGTGNLNSIARLIAREARSVPVYTSNVCKNCKRRYRLKWTDPDTGLCRRCG
jgi:hypothetical protein